MTTPRRHGAPTRPDHGLAMKCVAAITFSLLLAGAALAQGGTFTTGPTLGPANPVTPPPASPPAGNDIRANTVGGSAQNETSMAVNPIDARNWVGTANDYGFGGVQISWYTTQNAGQTWTTGTFGLEAGFSFSGDAAVTFDTQGVATIVGMMYDGPGSVDRVKTWRSLNGGLTWAAGVTLGALDGYDKPQIEADLSPTSPNRDHVLVAWNRFTGGLIATVETSVSSNQSLTWSAPQIISNANASAISPDVAWGPNGEAYVVWADRQLFDVQFDRSLNNGVTWGLDIKIADYTQVPSPLPGNGLRMFDIFAIHSDQSNGPFAGTVYAAWHTLAAGAGNHRSDVVVARSANQGTTWSAPVKVSSDGVQQNDQFFPGLVVDRQGNVNVAFYDQRNDVNDLRIWTWVARSANGGVTWTDTQVSDVGWNDSATEFPYFIGDYLDIDADARGLLHPFWCDGRLNSQDVFTDSVNLQLYTDVSTLSAATGGVVTFTIRTGPNLGGQVYLLAASGSGTSPGITLPNAVTVPLNFDVWTDFTINFANSPVFPGSVGVLDAQGAASAQMNTLGPFPAALAGIQLDFSVVTISGGIGTHATTPTRVTLVP